MRMDDVTNEKAEVVSTGMEDEKQQIWNYFGKLHACMHATSIVHSDDEMRDNRHKRVEHINTDW